jgi:ABC-type proline/glycine betaine transport system permease subunit
MSIVGADTLGDYILAGLALGDQVEVFAAAVLVAVLALLTEVGLGALQRRSVSPGIVGAERAFGESPEGAPAQPA